MLCCVCWVQAPSTCHKNGYSIADVTVKRWRCHTLETRAVVCTGQCSLHVLHRLSPSEAVTGGVTSLEKHALLCLGPAIVHVLQGLSPSDVVTGEMTSLEKHAQLSLGPAIVHVLQGLSPSEAVTGEMTSLDKRALLSRGPAIVYVLQGLSPSECSDWRDDVSVLRSMARWHLLRSTRCSVPMQPPCTCCKDCHRNADLVVGCSPGEPGLKRLADGVPAPSATAQSRCGPATSRGPARPPRSSAAVWPIKSLQPRKLFLFFRLFFFSLFFFFSLKFL